MNLKRIRIWNFRCIGTSDNSLSIQDDNPGIDVKLNPHVNVLIGANDSGKTAIVDAVKIILGTQTYDPIRLTDEDFYKSGQNRRSELKIECLFSDFSSIEAGQFLDWIAINDKNEYELRVWLSALRKNNRVIYNLKAGHDDEGTFMAGEARDLLRVTYLKPLRDAESELSPGYRSRLAQILSSHPIFIKEKNNNGEEIRHPLELYFKFANDKVELYFERDFLEENQEIGTKNDMKGGADVKRTIEKQTESFLEQGDSRKPKIEITNMELNAILRKLELSLEENKSGLGTLNQLYMATELIFLKGQGHNGLRLALIEELEAHLHPQAQLRVLRSLLDNKKGTSQNEQIQYIITTHSTTLGAAIPLEYLKLCHQGKVYSLDKETTALDEGSYKFLERFLDATKANCFLPKV
jgi:putative ATP-dependent endonuclease of OLD family